MVAGTAHARSGSVQAYVRLGDGPDGSSGPEGGEG